MHYYLAFGLRIESQIKLPLQSIEQNSLSQIDVRILQMAIPAHIRDQDEKLLYTRMLNGDVLCHIPEIALFWILAKKDYCHEIVIEPSRDASSEAIELFLLGSVIGVVLHREAGITVHGSAIKIDNDAVIFSGSSGIGKSTLATAATRSGYKLIADDVSVVRFEGDGRPQVWPAYPQIKLWKSTLDLFQMSEKNLKPLYKRIDKFAVPSIDSFYSSAIPLRAIIVLEAGLQKDLSYDCLSGIEAFQSLHNNTYRIEFLSKIGDAKKHFENCGKLLRQIPIYKLTRPKSGFDSIEMIESIVDFLRNREGKYETQQNRANELYSKEPSVNL